MNEQSESAIEEQEIIPGFEAGARFWGEDTPMFTCPLCGASLFSEHTIGGEARIIKCDGRMGAHTLSWTMTK